MTRVPSTFTRPYVALVRNRDGSFGPSLRGGDTLDTGGTDVPGATFDPGAGSIFGGGGASTVSFPQGAPSSSAWTPTSIATLFGAAATDATNALRLSQLPVTPVAPYVIPGTNVVYNPATGGVTTGVGTVAQQVGAGMTPMVIGGLAILGLIVMMSMRR